MADLTKLRAENLKRWQVAELTRDFEPAAERLVKAKSRYQVVESRTGVPWAVTAVIHERESSQSWIRSLAQGDPWDRVSVHVPAGRGPFRSWEDAACDALLSCPPYLARNDDWSIGATLARLEAYNGLGYFHRGVPSPYIWSGTDQYESGKYVRDGFYDPEAVDQQLGCAGLVKAMMEIDPTITFTGATLTPAPAPAPRPRQIPEPSSSLWTLILSIIRAIFSIFGRK